MLYLLCPTIGEGEIPSLSLAAGSRARPQRSHGSRTAVLAPYLLSIWKNRPCTLPGQYIRSDPDGPKDRSMEELVPQIICCAGVGARGSALPYSHPLSPIAVGRTGPKVVRTGPASDLLQHLEE